MKRGKKIKNILIALAAGVLATAEIMDEFLPSTTRSYYHNRKRFYATSTNADDAASRQEFYNLLNYLKREGFIEKQSGKDSIFWKITASGLKKLVSMKENKTNYEAEKDDKLKIITFDIPETLKKQRVWLREALRMLGFKMLQKSVWVGKSKIPEQFLFDLRKNNILSCVHIVEVGKSGTMREFA